MKPIHFLYCFLIFVSPAQSQITTIYFNSNENELKQSDFKILDAIYLELQNKISYQITINGYCDNTGNDNYNAALSNKRAKIIFEYFKSKNLKMNSISFKGYSISSPKGDNSSEGGKALNRRAEINIMFEDTKILIENLEANKIKKEPIPELKTEINQTTNPFSNTSLINNLEIGKKLVLKNMNFEGGTSMMLPQSAPTLKALLALLTENPNLEIEIDGHVCCANDMPLSIERAKAIMFYLTKNGIKQNRLSYKGFSNSYPISPEGTEVGRTANRRVEIVVLKK